MRGWASRAGAPSPWVLAAAAVVLSTVVAAPASEARVPGFTRVEGQVVAEAPTPEAVACAWARGGEASQGQLGWVVELSPREGDGRHVYRLATDGPVPRLDLAFFRDLPSCTSPPTVGPSLPPEGKVPTGARWAVLGRWTPDVGVAPYAGPHADPGSAVAVQFRFQVVDPGDPAPLAAFDTTTTVTEVPAGRPGLTVALSRARFLQPWSASHAVLTRMDVFADALAGAPLTAAGPMLGVWPDRLPTEVAEELYRVVPAGGTVHLLGGPRAISEAVAREVEALGLTPHRLAGATRVQTALAVADQVLAQHPGSDQVAVARARGAGPGDGSAWADAVAGGAWAAAHGVPVVLTDTDTLHPDVADWLARVRPSRTVLLGGEQALSAAVEQAVPGPRRVGGGDRAETAALVAEQLWEPSADDRNRYVVVHGWAELGWLWGLPAAGAAADAHAPVLLVDGDRVPDVTAGLVGSCQRTYVVVSGTSDDPAVGVTAPVVDRLERLADRRC